MGPNEVVEVINQVVRIKLHAIVLSFIAATTILLLLKSVAEAINGYIQFRLDQHVGIGSPVEIYGYRGRIKETSIFTITIETKTSYIRVPTKSWRFSQYIVLKDKLLCNDICEEEKE